MQITGSGQRKTGSLEREASDPITRLKTIVQEAWQVREQRANAELQDKRDQFARWRAGYDERRYQARKLQEREDFDRSLDSSRLANLAYLAAVGAIDSVSGVGVTGDSQGVASKVEGQRRLIESTDHRRSRTDDLQLARRGTSLLDAAAAIFSESELGDKVGA
jgi:hypothetical protein